MMFIVACGASSAILCVSCGFSALPSTFTISLVLKRLLGTLMAMVIMRFSWPVMPRILATSRACPPVMWSMTVPSFILLTWSSVSLMCVSPSVKGCIWCVGG